MQRIDTTETAGESYDITRLRQEMKQLLPENNRKKPAGMGLILLRGNPDSLSHYALQNIGRRYLEKHPPRQRSCHINIFDTYFHLNQAAAQRLKNHVSASDPYERWIYLAETYAMLNKSKGEMSDAILHAFATAFDKTADTIEKRFKKADDPGSGYTFELRSPQSVAADLKKIVNEFYSCKYRKDILLAKATP